jgi:hypothetical protein
LYDVPKVLKDPSQKQEEHEHCGARNKEGMQTFYGVRKSHTEYQIAKNVYELI